VTAFKRIDSSKEKSGLTEYGKKYALKYLFKNKSRLLIKSKQNEVFSCIKKEL
jgi:hypothetical protein